MPCQNNKNYFYDSDPSLTCKRLRRNIDRKKICGNAEVYQNCPQTCGACCKDDPNYTFQTRHGLKSCVWIAKSKTNKQWCNRSPTGKSKIKDACPLACDYCFSAAIISPGSGRGIIPPSSYPSSYPSSSPSSSSSSSPSALPTSYSPSSLPSYFSSLPTSSPRSSRVSSPTSWPIQVSSVTPSERSIPILQGNLNMQATNGDNTDKTLSAPTLILIIFGVFGGMLILVIVAKKAYSKLK